MLVGYNTPPSAVGEHEVVVVGYEAGRGGVSLGAAGVGQIEQLVPFRRNVRNYASIFYGLLN